MCSILYLPKGISIIESSITNMVLNNPDGVGLLVQGDDGKVVEAVRQFDPAGTKPTVVINLLKKHKDKNRLIHVRFNTHGESSLLNVHPFPVYSSKTRNVFMMHNGTMHDYRPPSTCDESMKEFSDSHYFAKVFAEPFFKHHTVGGDYTRGMSFMLLNRFVSGSSKVVFWGCGLTPMFIGPWITKKNAEGYVTYVASNDDYFDKVIPSRSIAARKEAASSTSNFMGYQNPGLRNSAFGVVTNFKDVSGKIYDETKTGVGKDTESFFSSLPQGDYRNEKGNNSRRQTALVESASYRFITPYTALSLKPSDLKEMIAEALAKISTSLESISPDDLWDIEGFGILCQVQPNEWKEVVEKHPTAVPGLMLLLAYALAEGESTIESMTIRANKQQTHINKMAAQLKELGGKYEIAA